MSGPGAQPAGQETRAKLWGAWQGQAGSHQSRGWHRAQSVPHIRCSVSGVTPLGTVPSAEVLQNLQLATIPADTVGEQQQAENAVALTPFASILPFLMALPLTTDPKEKEEGKPLRYLVEKGLPTSPMKLVEKAWNLEFVNMEEFLPAPRSLHLAEQGKPALICTTAQTILH